MYDILYRRPRPVCDSLRPSVGRSTTSESKTASQGSGGTSIFGIPEKLSFERIIQNGTCPPMTCRDFMKYLIYVEHGAENLQFYLWFRDYKSRFERLPQREKNLSPEYTSASDSPDVSRPTSAYHKPDMAVQRFITRAFTEVGGVNPKPSMQSTKSDPFSTPPRTPVSNNIAPFDGPAGDAVVDHEKVARDAFSAAEAAQPFTIQPFRDELNRIIAVYIAEGTPRELNLSDRDRHRAIKAIAKTTHPSALAEINTHIEELLRFQSHPNFIRWSICNGNQPRVVFAQGLGIALVLGGFLLAILFTLGDFHRGYRALAAIPWVLGIATLWAGIKGMCIVLHGLHHRHLRPWELWMDEDDAEIRGESKISFEEPLGGKNSYEDEPWVRRYDQRFIVKKIFDKQVWIEDPALRQIQNTIACQGILIGIVVSAILCGVFVAVPPGRFY